jgi:hypothetical protein
MTLYYIVNSRWRDMAARRNAAAKEERICAICNRINDKSPIPMDGGIVLVCEGALVAYFRQLAPVHQNGRRG